MSDDEKSNDPSAIIIPFGKHKGKTVSELLATDQPYADWVTAQGWVAERFAELHAAIVTRGAGTDDTPEHNALQARFLDEPFRSVILSSLLDITKTTSFEALRHTAEYERDLFETPKVGWERIAAPRAAEAKAVLDAIERDELAVTSRVEFEVRGLDAVISYGVTIGPRKCLSDKIGVEIKPTIGDDYPSVMRQMGRLGARILVVGNYTGRGVSEPQMVEMFKASGFRVLFLQEIEEALRNPPPSSAARKEN